MNPVSTRGRSMPRDRRTFRAVVVAMGILGCVCLDGLPAVPHAAAIGRSGSAPVRVDRSRTRQPARRGVRAGAPRRDKLREWLGAASIPGRHSGSIGSDVGGSARTPGCTDAARGPVG